MTNEELKASIDRTYETDGPEEFVKKLALRMFRLTEVQLILVKILNLKTEQDVETLLAEVEALSKEAES